MQQAESPSGVQNQTSSCDQRQCGLTLSSPAKLNPCPESGSLLPPAISGSGRELQAYTRQLVVCDSVRCHTPPGQVNESQSSQIQPATPPLTYSGAPLRLAPRAHVPLPSLVSALCKHHINSTQPCKLTPGCCNNWESVYLPG